MKIFVINLLKDVDRLTWFRNEMRLRWPGMEYEVVEAVFGKDLPEDEFHRLVDVEKARRILGREIGRGEVGVVLSMQKVFARMVAENIPTAIIFEDDVRLGSRLKDVAPILNDWLLSKHDGAVLLLSEASRVRLWAGKRLKGCEVKICRPLTIYGAYGYFINLSGAKALLKYNTPVVRCSDVWGDYQRDGVVEVYSTVPHLVGNNDFSRKASNLSAERLALWNQRQKDSEVGMSKRLRIYARVYSKRVVDLLTGTTVTKERTNNQL